MLRDLIRKELSSATLDALSHEEVEEVSAEISDTMRWCGATPKPEICTRLEAILRTVVKSLSDARLMKQSFSAIPDKSVDSKLLSVIKNLARKYYALALSGIMTHDGKVPIKFKQAIQIGMHTFEPHSLTYIGILDALLLEELGVAEVLIPPNLLE
ncbi:MAG: hypothetical protein J7L55_02845 [Desulfurococcales archaeon]|nr:hypothetical protein [Desulfurococcales archaeon]